jgi:hypothetical protein
VHQYDWNALQHSSHPCHPTHLAREEIVHRHPSVGEGDDGRFALTEISELPRTDVKESLAPMSLMLGRPARWNAWGELLFSVCNGATAFEHLHGTTVWEYRATHPEDGRVFDDAMASVADWLARGVMEAYDFGGFEHLVDVGGGDGEFLLRLLAAHPRLHGTLVDQPQVIACCSSKLLSLGLTDRCRPVAGDFFTSVPEGADAYLLKWILHDWDNAAAIEILRCCRRAMRPTSTLIVVDHVVGPPNNSPEGKFLDLTMMVMTGGRERTREEFAALFAKSGLRVKSIAATATPLSVIEAVADRA